MVKIHQFYFNSFPSQISIPAFRGAFVKAMGDRAMMLMHNHVQDGLRYAYPLVQYKYVNDLPAIIAFGDTGDTINDVFQSGQIKMNLYGRIIPLTLLEHKTVDFKTIIDITPKYYSLTSWLPLTDGKEKQYDAFMSLTDRICMLENVLVGNVLSFFKGIGCHIEERLFCVISDVHKEYIVTYKNVKFRAFDIHFVTNILLPDYIGIGKSSSVGMGVLRKEELPDKYKNSFNA